MQEAIDKVKGSLARLRAEALGKYEQSNQQPPAILYQYTDATGLMGILQSGAVWATDARFLNDAAELEYFRQAVQEIASEAKPALRTAHAVRFADELLESRNDQFFMGSIYVASFSADPDVLSQWRAYASDGLGYAVGFSSAAQLVPKEHPEWYQPPRLRKVVYEHENQGAILRPLVAECLRLLDGLAAEAPAAIEEALAVARDTVAALVSELYAVIKNPGFAQENEWRCVFWNHAPGGYLEPLKFRSTRFGVTPYVELGWTDGSGQPVKPPIKRLVLGPRLPKESEGAAYMLLLSNGYSAGCGELEAEIVRSRVSYR